MRLTRQQHREWLDHPITEMFFDSIQADYDLMKEQWAAGGFKKEVENVEAIGAIGILRQLIAHEYFEEIPEGEQDEA